MTRYLVEFAQNTWLMVAQMAPYLVFGFVVAGILHLLIKPQTVQRLLGKPGLANILKACVIGVPMPLCSCSVIPVTASLRKSGASSGSTTAFLTATPQTGIDSIFATYSLMGGVFTSVRIMVAFISGIATGFLVEIFCKEQHSVKINGASSGRSGSCSQENKSQNHFRKSFRYGIIDLPADIAIALSIGLILAGLFTTVIPDGLFEAHLSSNLLSFLVVTLISLPLYICATASIPMAYALIAAGFSPGAALVFLITGPATNTATIATVWKMLGRKTTAIYLTSLFTISWLAGWFFNASMGTLIPMSTLHIHEESELLLWQHLCGIILVFMLALAFYLKRQSNKKMACCC